MCIPAPLSAPTPHHLPNPYYTSPPLPAVAPTPFLIPLHHMSPPATDPAGIWRLGSPQLRVGDAPSHRTPYPPMSPLTPLCHPLPPGVIPYVPLPQIRPVFGDSGAHNFGLTTRRLTEPPTPLCHPLPPYVTPYPPVSSPMSPYHRSGRCLATREPTTSGWRRAVSQNPLPPYVTPYPPMSPPTPRCHPLCPPTTDPAGVWRLGSPQLRVDDAPSHRTHHRRVWGRCGSEQDQLPQLLEHPAGATEPLLAATPQVQGRPGTVWPYRRQKHLVTQSTIYFNSELPAKVLIILGNQDSTGQGSQWLIGCPIVQNYIPVHLNIPRLFVEIFYYNSWTCLH